MADVIEIPGGGKVARIPIADNDFGKVHTFSVPLKNGDAPNCRVDLLETEESETVIVHVRPGQSQRLRVGAKCIFARAISPSGLTLTAEQV